MTRLPRCGPHADLIDEFSWSDVTARAFSEVFVRPATHPRSLAALMDQQCLPLLSGTGSRSDLWLWLVGESRRDPAGAIAQAMQEQRERALTWATSKVSMLQATGEVRSDLAADHIAATLLIELESLVATLRLSPDLAHGAYADTRARCLSWCATDTMQR